MKYTWFESMLNGRNLSILVNKTGPRHEYVQRFGNKKNKKSGGQVASPPLFLNVCITSWQFYYVHYYFRHSANLSIIIFN